MPLTHINFLRRYYGYFQAVSFLVTGGGSGMGRSFTLELARLGADVTFCDINEGCAGRPF